MTSSPKRVMIYVQHLLGVGHLQRSAQLATALAEQGFEVKLVSGGMPYDGIATDAVQLSQLPALRSLDGRFTDLVDSLGNPIDESWKQRRQALLLDIFRRFEPDVLVTETFPFGRRMMRFELLPLLEAARALSKRVIVISSIRDILQPKTAAGRNQETCELIERYYDYVLVHGDENIARLEHSFALADRIGDRIYYSGYIARPALHQSADDAGRDEVLVSAGGSATGLRILKTAIAARPLSCLDKHSWRLLVSPAISAANFAVLQSLAPDSVKVQRNLPDFSERLARARLSISQAGYNTITDLLQTQTAACVIPYAEAEEVEQTMRAKRLQQLGRVIMLEEQGLTPESMAQAIRQATNQQSDMPAVNLNGARQSAAMIEQWVQM